MAKQEDINGFWLFLETCISREGVFPYKGKQIDSDGKMGLDPNRKYNVYRSASEVTNPKTLESFNGIFLTDEHQMLGDGQRDPGTKRIDGSVYNVHVDPKEPGVVKATLKVQSAAMKNLIQSGKRALSCGYYCDYRPEKGVFNGQPYDFVQVDLTGNHLALVKKGRMGEKCAVMDACDFEDVFGVFLAKTGTMDSADYTDVMIESEQFANLGRKESQVRGKGRKIACDSAIDITQKEVKFMPNENYDEMLAKALEGKGVKDKANIEKIIEFIGTLPASAADPAKDGADPALAGDPSAAPVVPAEPVAPTAPIAPVDPTMAKDGDPAVDPTAVVPPTDTAAPTALTKEEFQSAVDAAVESRYIKEDEGRQLAEDIAPKVGCNVWKRGMDADDVAEAACEKLGHKDLPKEARIPFVKAITKEDEKRGADKSACDSAFDTPVTKSSTMQKYLGK